jgi:hypothetical protein
MSFYSIRCPIVQLLSDVRTHAFGLQPEAVSGEVEHMASSVRRKEKFIAEGAEGILLIQIPRVITGV